MTQSKSMTVMRRSDSKGDLHFVMRLVLCYFYVFLILDSVTGFLVKYKNLDLFLNPGQIVRGSILILLMITFFYDIQDRINRFSRYMIVLLFFFVFFLLVIFIKTNSFSLIIKEFAHISKILLVILLIYFVIKNYENFKHRLDRIILANFFVFSFTLITGYFTKIGLSTHPYIDDASKGMLHGGNPAAVLALVFFTYFLWNLCHKFSNALFLIISLFNIHIISTKAIFVVPILFIVYIIHTLPKLKSPRIFIYGIILFPIILFISFLLSPKIIRLVENRYIVGIQKSYETYSEQGGVFRSPLTAPLEMVTYRRNLAAKEQLIEIFQNPQSLVVGHGFMGQKSFWMNKEKKFHDASMDFIDILFQYGVIGMFLVFFPIIKATLTIGKNAQLDRNSVIVVILVFYSFFAGHVISSGPAGTTMALFVGLVLGETEKNKKRSIYRIFLDKFSWLKK